MSPKIREYIKKVGWLGFFFFLGKGMVWLYIFYVAGKFF
jgi:hypothetical protein